MYAKTTLPAGAIEFLHSRFPDAVQIFVGGSYAKGVHNDASDIDVVVLHERVCEVRREVYAFNGKLFDIAEHDLNSLEAMVKIEYSRGVCSLADDVFHATHLLAEVEVTSKVRGLVEEVFSIGPPKFDGASLKSHLLGQIDDLEYGTSRAERLALALNISSQLLIFMIRMRGGWLGAGKYLGRDALRADSRFVGALDNALQAFMLHDNHHELLDLAKLLIRRETGDLSARWQRSIKPHELQSCFKISSGI